MKKIGLLGGTFDPPHVGHLLIAEEVFEKLHLDEVWFIPSYTPPHKEGAKTSAEHRVKMLQLAIKGHPNFSVNSVEVDRKGVSYTVETLDYMKAEHPNKEFYFIIGADMVEYLPKWNRIEDLYKLVKFVGVKRSGYTLTDNQHVIELEIPSVDVSSTMIRNRIKKGLSTRYLIPERVRDYIKEHHLYES